MVRVSLLYFGPHSALPFSYVAPDILRCKNIETSLLLLKVCSIKVITQKTIPEPTNRSDDV